MVADEFVVQRRNAHQQKDSNVGFLYSRDFGRQRALPRRCGLKAFVEIKHHR